jgi:hypothetical protein
MFVLISALALGINAGLSHPAHAEEIHRTYSFAVEKPSNIVQDATMWLYHYAWGDLTKFPLAKIENGTTEVRLSQRKLDEEIHPRSDTEAYIILLELSAHWWYRTDDIPPEQLFRKLAPSIEALGKKKKEKSGATLIVLPDYRLRRLRFEDEDGKPVSGLEVPVSMYVFDFNHCGAHFGPFLGNYLTDPVGEINVPAPAVPLYLDVRYYEPEGPGPAGEMYHMHAGLRVGRDPHEVIRKTWQLPSGPFQLRVERPDGTPAPGLFLTGCMKIAECGANCGGGFGSTNADGVIEASLQSQNIQSLSLIDPQDRKRELTDEEMRELFTNRSVEITW